MYRQIIQQATGETDAQKLADIEECMRQDIFHSTLDWQTAAQLKRAAREAVKLLAAIEQMRAAA